MQQVGPRHTVGEGSGAQPRDRAQAQQIFLRQRGQCRAHVALRRDGFQVDDLNKTTDTAHETRGRPTGPRPIPAPLLSLL